MRDGIIYDCPHADCRTPIYTGKCRRECLERYNKEMGGKPMTNADRIRAMSVPEMAQVFVKAVADGCPPDHDWECRKNEDGWDACDECWAKWLKQHAEGE